MHRRSDDTDRVSRKLHAEIANLELSDGQKASGASPDEFLDRLAEKLASRVGRGDNDGGNGRGNGRKLLGVQIGSWMQWVVGFLILGVIGAATWWLKLRDDLRDRPTTEQVREVLDAKTRDHEDRGSHPKIEQRLEGLEGSQRLIRESQVRQEGIDSRQADTLEAIRDDLRNRRR